MSNSNGVVTSRPSISRFGVSPVVFLLLTLLIGQAKFYSDAQFAHLIDDVEV